MTKPAFRSPLISRRTALAAGAGLAALPLAPMPFGRPAAAQLAAARVNAPAPAFAAADSNGREVTLADLRGKTVVLEFTNHDCPFVRKHYGTSNMQNLQRRWTERGVVWLTIASSPRGEQGHVTPEQANELTRSRNAAPTAVLLDGGEQIVARAYGAQVTPHMFIINAEGQLVYAGGIDDRPTARAADVEGARNFVDLALTELSQGKPVSNPTTRAYGCVVKYSS
ncbi:redoxin domain-containing protein [Phreatobacter sp.]|uniref:redoxin domain-containing protein n=1 Tax=Phreatobacter sp. TaxID=1966341 RepID=UPI003F6EF656